jgi:methylase of polypeptide subunit release factors
LLEQVSLNLSEDDHMYKGNDSHYLSVGASALSVIESARGLAFAHQVDNILDFGIGAGRVARWLRAVFPQAQIEGSDTPPGHCSLSSQSG